MIVLSLILSMILVAALGCLLAGLFIAFLELIAIVRAALGRGK
jgi:hypothetical protein